MYRMNRQMRIEDFVFPYGQLDKNNEWVKLADLVPWDEAEEVYARQFVNNGHPAHPHHSSGHRPRGRGGGRQPRFVPERKALYRRD